MQPNELTFFAVWTWFRNNPHATFQEFMTAFERAARIGQKTLREGA